jgi:hypothetical protein
MQISAANLIVAAQQALNKPSIRPVAPAQSAAQPEAAESAGFEPISFKQAAPERPAQAATAQQPAATPRPIGSQVDIRV